MTVGFDSAWSTMAAVEASDGYPLCYRRWTPNRGPSSSRIAAAGAPRPSVVLLNGIMSNSTWFSPLVPGLLESGFSLVGADRRGSGRNRRAWGDAPSAGQLVDDVLSIVGDAVHPSSPLLLVGWCWGAALAVAAAHKLKERVCGLVLVTPGMFNTAAIRDAMDAQRDRMEAAEPIEPVVDSPIREEWFTTGPALGQFILQDPDRVLKITPRMVQLSAKLNTSAVARLRTLQVPLLVLLAEDEQATDNDATRRALEPIDPTRLEVVTLPTKHGMQFDAPQAVVDQITTFADRVVTSPA